jgi:hypothetical protein
MSYIGRGVDAISNVEKLTNITFDGSTTYNLVKDGVAFTPSGKNNILISIDGVVQQNNFTVSGSTIIFDWSPASSNTCNWIQHYGVGVLNTPADSSVNMAQLGASGTKSSSTFLAGDNTFKTVAGTTINTNGNDRLITGSGTANTLTGETNLTYNGTILGVGASADLGAGVHIKVSDTGASVNGSADELIIERSGDNGMTFLNSVSGESFINFGDSGDNDIGQMSYHHSSNHMAFKTNASERMRITSGGIVGVGATASSADLGTGLHVRTSDSGATVNANFDELVLESSGNAGLSILTATDGYAGICFGDSGNNQIGSVIYNHGDNSMQINTSATIGIRIEGSGEVTTPRNPAFRIYQSTQTTYASGHTMYNQNTTEEYDVNADIASGTFTAPVTGKYLFSMSYYDVTSAENQQYYMEFITSNRNYRWANINYYRNGYTGASGNMKGEGTLIVDMDVNDTAYVKCGSSTNVDNGNNAQNAYYSGILIG